MMKKYRFENDVGLKECGGYCGGRKCQYFVCGFGFGFVWSSVVVCCCVCECGMVVRCCVWKGGWSKERSSKMKTVLVLKSSQIKMKVVSKRILVDDNKE